MQEKLTRQSSSVRPGSGAYGSVHMLSAFLWGHLGNKSKCTWVSLVKKEIATGGGRRGRQGGTNENNLKG